MVSSPTGESIPDEEEEVGKGGGSGGCPAGTAMRSTLLASSSAAVISKRSGVPLLLRRHIVLEGGGIEFSESRRSTWRSSSADGTKHGSFPSPVVCWWSGSGSGSSSSWWCSFLPSACAAAEASRDEMGEGEEEEEEDAEGVVVPSGWVWGTSFPNRMLSDGEGGESRSGVPTVRGVEVSGETQRDALGEESITRAGVIAVTPGVGGAYGTASESATVISFEENCGVLRKEDDDEEGREEDEAMNRLASPSFVSSRGRGLCFALLPPIASSIASFSNSSFFGVPRIGTEAAAESTTVRRSRTSAPPPSPPVIAAAALPTPTPERRCRL